jgi:hypothetical protein
VNTGFESITDEGKGPYVHGIDATRCEVNQSGGDHSGDLLFTLNNGRTKTSLRSALLSFNNPVAGSLNRGLWVVGGLFHLKVRGLRDIPIGATIVHHAGYHVPYLSQSYKLRYGAEVGDGTSPVIITRETATRWRLSAAQPYIARLWTGGGYGDGTVYEPQGDYYMPFTLIVTLN